MLRSTTLPALLCASVLLAGLAACDSDRLTTEPPPEGNDTTPPAAPSSLAGISEDGAVMLEWSAPDASDLAGYYVYRSASAFSNTGDAQRLDDNSLLTESTYRDTGVQNGTTYYYRVTAVDESGNESGLSGTVEKTPFPDPPDEP